MDRWQETSGAYEVSIDIDLWDSKDEAEKVIDQFAAISDKIEIIEAHYKRGVIRIILSPEHFDDEAEFNHCLASFLSLAKSIQ